MGRQGVLAQAQHLQVYASKGSGCHLFSMSLYAFAVACAITHSCSNFFQSFLISSINLSSSASCHTCRQRCRIHRLFLNWSVGPSYEHGLWLSLICICATQK